MRITRVRLRDYRGTPVREVSLLGVGVTVVEGPNEVGKSSLAEAIDVVFDERDSTTKAAVRALQPAGRDVGTLVEVDVETGPYAFTYAKVFNRGRATSLRLSRPAPAQLTGRAAHERVSAILAETIDPVLWRALRAAQGASIRRPALGGSAALVAVLQRLGHDAGDSSGPAHDDATAALDLLERVEAEYARWFTDRGGARQALHDADADVARARARVADADHALAALRARADRAEQLLVELGDLRRDEARAAADAADAVAVRDTARAAAAAIRARRLEASSATAQADAAKAASRTRHALVRRVAAAMATAASATEAAQSAPAAEAAAQHALGAAHATLADAGCALEQAAAAAAGAAATVAVLDAAAALLDLRYRVRRGSAAEAAALVARRCVDEGRVDNVALAELRALDAAADRAATALAAGRSALTVRVLGEHPVLVDGAILRGGRGERLDVETTVVVAVDGVVEVVVEPASTTAALREAAAATHAALAARCAALDVSDLADAEAAFERRCAAERALAEAASEQRAALGTRALSAWQDEERQLTNSLFSLRDDPDVVVADVVLVLVDAVLAAGGDGAWLGTADPLAAEVAAARRDASLAATQSASRLALARAVLQDATLAAERAADACASAGVERERRNEAAAASQAAAAVLEEELAAERDTAADEQLDAVARDVADRAAAATASVEAAVAAAGDADPDAAALAADAAVERAELAAAATARALAELLDLRARLEERGRDGLEERRAEAEAEVAAAERTAAALHRRADAARALRDAMVASRDAARVGWARPLRDRITELGRVVFGADFAVELDDDLAVARRTLGGVTLPFEALSAGAQEQLAVLTRLAAAQLVAGEDCGAPVVLDDALGSSDERRLAAMGQLLALAGERCQVVVLTCVPERYREIPGAKVVTLP